MKKYLLFYLMVIGGISAFTACKKAESTQSLPLNVIFKGKIPPYEKLYLKVEDHKKAYAIEGIQIDSVNWQFPIPDSLWERSSYMLLYSMRTENDSLVVNSSFSLGISDLTKATFFHGWNNLPSIKNPTLTLRYDGRSTVSVPIKNDKGMFVKEDRLDDDYTVVYPDREMLLSITSFGMPCKDTTRQELQKWIKFHQALAAQYPDSRVLMEKLFQRSTFFSIEELTEIYTQFSDSLRQHSYYGQKVGQLLYNITSPIVNKQYLNPVSQKQEWLITDSTRHNLLIFSASWCAPCQKIIPLLKRIHTDLGDKLAMIYITTEEEKTLPAWQKKMTTENIPWRSLWMPDKQERFEKFQVQGIPDAILVSPDGKMKKLELRNEGDKKLLYDQVLSQ